jgi:flavin reductase (DIM6/NTAB) family NADH-FMN oxidoreductase RutF
MADFPTAVTVVTALGGDGPTGATANAVTSLSLEPPLMLACLDRGSRTLGAVQSGRRFAINVLAAGQDELARRFSTKDPHPVKWDGVPWSELAGTPRIDGALLWIACDLRDLHDGGDHAIATGRILELESTPGDPLLFHRGEYRSLN